MEKLPGRIIPTRFVGALLTISLAISLASCKQGESQEADPVSTYTEAVQTPTSIFTNTPAATQTEVPQGVYPAPAYPPAYPFEAVPSPYIAPVGEIQTPYPLPQTIPTTDQAPTPIAWQIYADPAGQFTVKIPAGWQPEEEEGSFRYPDGYFRTAYLPEMGFMQNITQVCMRLANTPQGPVRHVGLHGPHSCTLTPYPETGTDSVQVVFENATTQPDLRFFYIEADAAHIAGITSSLQMAKPLSRDDHLPIPAGPMRPEDETFWKRVDVLPTELSVEEYPLITDTAQLSWNLYEYVPQEVISQLRQRSLSSQPGDPLDSRNSTLKTFGYSIKQKNEAGYGHPMYQLYQGEKLLFDNIRELGPVTTNSSRDDFALEVRVINSYDYLVRKGNIEQLEPRLLTMRETSWVFLGDELAAVYWKPERGQLQIEKGKKPFYAFTTFFTTNSQLKKFLIKENDWFLEVGGFLIQNGENLNEKLGYEEIFNLRYLNDRLFYFFRKGPRVGISYGGKILPVYYDEVYHLGCCGYAMNNPGGDERQVHFFALRDGMWHFVQVESSQQ